MQEAKEEDPNNIWKFKVLMPPIKRHHPAWGSERLRFSRSTAEQRSLQELQSFPPFQAGRHIPFLFVRCCAFAPLPATVAARGALQCWLISTSQYTWKRQIWLQGRVGESWGNGEKGLGRSSWLRVTCLIPASISSVEAAAC